MKLNDNRSLNTFLSSLVTLHSSFVMKLTGIGMGLLFSVWTYYQYNDVDPGLWMAVYGITGVLSFLFAFNKIPYWGIGAWGGVCLIWAIWIAPQIEYVGNLILIELWREMMGLVVIALWCGVAAFWLYKRNTTPVAETT